MAGATKSSLEYQKRLGPWLAEVDPPRTIGAKRALKAQPMPIHSNTDRPMPPFHRHSDPVADCAQVVAALAEDLNVTPEQIDGIYRRELSRLATGARIPQFVVTLAVRNTRRILRRS